MRKTLIALALTVAACSPEPAAVPEPTPPPAPAPAPAPEPAPAPREPYTYGDDPTLDRLWDRCDNDDLDACDTLFWDSPLNSDYEAYALDRIDELERSAPSTANDVVDEIGVGPILDVVWAGMSRQERDDLCGGVILFGSVFAAEIVVDSSGMDLSVDDVAEWLADTCGL